jgi:hypothetical protein
LAPRLNRKHKTNPINFAAEKPFYNIKTIWCQC